MPASNVGRYYFALQSAKGSVASAPQYSVDVTGAELAPTPETEQRSETGLGRDPGDTYIRVLQAGGGMNVLLRAKTAALFLYGVLGAKAVTQLGTAWAASTAKVVGDLGRPTAGGSLWEVTTAGTTGTTEPTWSNSPNIGDTIPDASVVWTRRQNSNMYEHTLTPANDQPWFTVWRMLGDSIYERFDDCKITASNIEWGAGGDVTAAMSIFGLKFTRLTSIPAGGAHDSATPLRVPGVIYTLEGATDNSLTNGNVNIEANQGPIQTVDITNSYLEPGPRNITGSYEQVYTDVTRYAKVYYGSGTGTSPSETVYTGALNFKFGKAYGPRLEIDVPKAGFTGATANPDPGGDPLRLPVAWSAYRPASGDITTAKVRNDVASYGA